MPEVTWDIIKNIGTISEGAGGWKKEINIISWNSKAAKLDIRSWDTSHKKMSKGITLNKEEVKKIREMLNAIDIDSLEI